MTPATTLTVHRLPVGAGAPDGRLTAALRAVTDAAAADPTAPLVLALEPAPHPPARPEGLPAWSRWEKELIRLERLPAPVVALLDGTVHGTALQLALATDLRFATPDTVLAATELADGYLPGLAIQRLVRQLGVGHARRMVLSGAGLTATDAERLGLLDAVDPDPAGAAARLLAVRAIAPPLWHLARRLLLESHESSTEDALGGTLAAQERALREGALT
ncbi:enoyl-CoA hydratase/isomerase family protein [Kitasatospora sp. NPDC056446]|uniref:enoyl-CoA hydratase/isomerase family protein n=1 Tax=Kitasatospora sp. NPDC056446 TaxID=3345819 RepID=UPI00369189FF